MSLSQVFLQHAGNARAKFAHLANLEPRLQEMANAAGKTWPNLAVPAETFVIFIAEKLAVTADPSQDFADLHVTDLYLALACSTGNEAALRLFEKHFLAAATKQVSRRAQDRTFLDDLAQRLRTRLFAPENGSPPRITTYTGQGPLGGWLCAVASRLAVDLHRENNRHPTIGAHDLDIRNPEIDPELDYLKTLYHTDLQQAFRATLLSLSIEEANILRLHFLDNATISALANLYRVSTRTVARRIADARQKIIEETRRLLAKRLDLPQSQVNTLMAMVQSQVQSIVREFFEEPAEAKKP